MVDGATWARRVAEWKSSGLSSTKYCEGKPFTPGGLRHWAHRLRHGDPRGRTTVRVAKVVRLSRPKPPPPDESASVPMPDIILALGGARIAVRPGFDRATLAAVLEVVGGTVNAR